MCRSIDFSILILYPVVLLNFPTIVCILLAYSWIFQVDIKEHIKNFSNCYNSYFSCLIPLVRTHVIMLPRSSDYQHFLLFLTLMGKLLSSIGCFSFF